MNKKKIRVKSANEENSSKEKKKMSRFGKLYIAAAICTACVSLVVLAVTTKISDSALKQAEEMTISIPTSAPIDSLIKEPSNLVPIEPIKTPEPKSLLERTPEPAVTPEEIESVETGLFKKNEKIKLIMPTDGDILNECSLYKLKKSKTLGDWRTHNGVDIKSDISDAVNAAADGTIVLSEYDTQMGYVVKIEHEGGYETVYANLASNEMAEVGRKINAGECLGAVGDSAVFEKLEEAHLHFELKKDGKYINPMEYME